MEKWADRRVDFHFCGILSPWTRRALVAGGFGQGKRRDGTNLEIAPVVKHGGDVSSPQTNMRDRSYEASGSNTPVNDEDSESYKQEKKSQDSSETDLEAGRGVEATAGSGRNSQHTVPLILDACPMFHIDLSDALASIDLSRHT